MFVLYLWHCAFITHDDGSNSGTVFSVCLSVCLSVFFLHDISKTAAARIAELDGEMFHHES